MLQKNMNYPLSKIIEWAKGIIIKFPNNYDGMNIDNQYIDFRLFYIYSDNKNESKLTLNNYYFYADYPEIIEDEEIYPAIFYEKKLTVIYSGESFMSVICSVYEQKIDATDEEYVKALNYYYENDDFLEF